MSHANKSYPSARLRKQLWDLGLPLEKHELQELKELMKKHKFSEFADKDVNELAEVLIYLAKRSLITLG